ncbi:MAG: helix-turn-helix transcriptional regulator [Sulfuricellaceae bacterium]
MTSIAARLQDILTGLNKTAKAMAAETGMPYRTLQGYLRGEREPNPEGMEKISRLGVNLHWLITGEGEMLLGSSQDAENFIVKRYKESRLEGGYSGINAVEMAQDPWVMRQFVQNYNDSDNEIIWQSIPSWVRHYVSHLSITQLERWLEKHEKSQSPIKNSPFEMRYYPALMGRITEAIKIHYAEWFNDLGEEATARLQEKLYTCLYKLGANNEKLPETTDILAILALARKLGAISIAPGDPCPTFSSPQNAAGQPTINPP